MRGGTLPGDLPLLDTRQLQQVGGRLGSNPAGIYQDGQGRRYYIKSLESVAHARNELCAARLYRLAGAPTLTYLTTANPMQVATRWVELETRCVAHLSEAERRQAQRWFGVHAWTANWDVAGYNGDNQGTFEGRVLTLDVGGALDFRAQGDPKGAAFGSRVTELERLRHDRDNPHAVRLFADMDSTALLCAIERVLQIPDTAIRQALSGSRVALIEKMLARKADMARESLTLRAAMGSCAAPSPSVGSSSPPR